MILSLITFIFTAPLNAIYWIKWAVAYAAIRFHNACNGKRFDAYDNAAIGDPVKLGYIVPQLEKDVESPFPESHLQEAADEVCFYGVNSKSECLLVRIDRGADHVSEAWIHLKLANGKTYHLVENVGHQQEFDGGKCVNFSCGNLQMHYLWPMRRWRIFFCGMLNESSENKTEEGVFVKFVFLWKASSDVYDLTLGTNPCGFAGAMARTQWTTPFVPPIYKFIDTMNFYAQSGVINGTVSVNDGDEYEMYLFGEKMRSLGKSANIAGCKFTHIVGNVNENGLTLHLGKASAPNIFNNLPCGFTVFPDGHLETVKELDISIKPFTTEKSGDEIKASFSCDLERKFEIHGTVVGNPIVLYSGQGWSGFLEVSFVEFTMGNNKGSGLLMSGEVYKESLKPTNLKADPDGLATDIPLTVPFSDEVCHFGDVSGGKGSSLGKLTRLSVEEKSFTVPKGIVVSTVAYKEFLTAEIEKEIEDLENVLYGKVGGSFKDACKRVSGVIEKTSMPNRICHSIIANLKLLFGDEMNQKKYAVRSSATGEDTAAMSAAGQMDTFLGVQGLKEIFLAVKKCWASQFGHIATEYKRRNGQILNSPMAVVIQEMVACDVSGVLFTCDPVNNNPSVITITANYGLGETVVSGSVEPDTVTLKRDLSGQLEFDSVIVGDKHQKITVKESGGTITEDVPESLRRESCLSNELALHLGKVAMKIEKYFKSSRDIEWGIVDNHIYILQSRPVTNINAETEFEMKHEFDAPVRCGNEYFTIANIGEVMPGACSVLGYEFISKYFSNVFKKMANDQGITDNYLPSRYLPGLIQRFYNHMMGTVVEVTTRYGIDTPLSKGLEIGTFGRLIDDTELRKYAKQKLELAQPSPKQTLRNHIQYYWDLFFHDFNTRRVKQSLDNYHRNFMKFNTAKETLAAILKSCSDFDEAGIRHMTSSESSLNWNMKIFQILADAHGRFDTSIYADFARLLATSADVESANVPQAMQEVATLIAKDIGSDQFKSLSAEEALECLEKSTSPSGHGYRQFLKRHGHRCLKESDVSSITWGMDPKALVKLLQNLTGFSKNAKKEGEVDGKIISQLNIPLGFWSRLKLKFILPNCRKAIRGREAGKSCTMKAMDHWRQGVRYLGKQMVSEGRIPEIELIFFMTLDEIKDLLETRSPAIISRAIYRKRLNPTLDDYQFPEIMQGLPKPINENNETAEEHEFESDLTMKGTPVSQGLTKGYARVAVSLKEASQLKPGEVLITYSTDIGWSPYFPMIAGVVTELGGLISHGAVVSREYGLPCVVGLRGATKRFHTGDYVQLDGKSGTLRRLPKPEQ